jgi:hypothetical protein
MLNDFDFVKFKKILRKKIHPRNNLCCDGDIEEAIIKYSIGDFDEFIKTLISAGLIRPRMFTNNGKLHHHSDSDGHYTYIVELD